MPDLAVVCFLWCGGRRAYRAEHVNVLCRSVRRNLALDHRFVCITDETEGFDVGVDLRPLPAIARQLADIETLERRGFPSSFRRLWTLSGDACELGDRILMLDIDCVITGSLAPLLEVDADFVGWRPNVSWGTDDRIGGGTWLLRAGSRVEAWQRFVSDPHGVIASARAAGYRGSDQAVLSYLLQGCTVWPPHAGIYGSEDMHPSNFKVLPDDARIVHFNGRQKPWHRLELAWVMEHWQ